jgi:hypothetical protein
VAKVPKYRVGADFSQDGDHLCVSVFDEDGNLVETYDIERKPHHEKHVPKQMSLEEIREWMRLGCPNDHAR